MAETARRRLTRDYATGRERAPAGNAVRKRTLRELTGECLPAAAGTLLCALWSVYGGIAPAGMAAVAVSLLCAPEMYVKPGLPVFFAVAGGTVGLYLSGHLSQAAACVALYAVWLLLRARGRAPGLRSMTFLAAVLTLTVGLSIGRHTMLDGILCALSAGATAVMTPVLHAALGAQMRRRRLLTAEEMICLALAAVALLGGTHHLAIGAVSPALGCAFVLALASGAIGGSAVGAAGGLLVGACLALTDRAMADLAVTMGLAGLMAGSFRRAGRAASSAAFFLGIVIAAAIGGAAVTSRLLLHAAPACVALPLLPRRLFERVLERVESAKRTAARHTASEGGAMQRVERRLEECARLFSSLAAMLHIGGNREEEKTVGAARQMDAIADTFVQLAQEAGARQVVDEASTTMLLEMLDREGMRASAEMVRTPDGVEGFVRFDNCTGSGECARRVGTMVSVCAGRRMRMRGPCTPGEGPCSLAFEQVPTFDAITGVACRPVHVPSGDSYTFRALPGGRLMMAIADGMGTGSAAAGESDRALTLLEQFLQTRIEPMTALSMINDLMMLRGGEEIYTTLDLCLIDTRAGVADFYKIGAANSYIRRGQDVMTVLSGALPMGILAGVSPAHRQISLRDGDVIVMASDGVCDASREESWMPTQLKRMDPRNPQATADMLEAAARHEAGSTADDRTVLCARVFQKMG